MPVEFLSDERAAAFGRFAGAPSRSELERYFFLDDADRALVEARRGEHNRLGFALQLTTVRFVGRFLPDPVAVPTVVVDYLAGQLGLPDASCIKRYAEQRHSTQWEHAAEIRRVYGYTNFADTQAQAGLTEFVSARAFTHAEGPTALFEQAIAWLRARRVLLPGTSVLARLVAGLRDQATEALWASVAAAAAHSDAGLPARLDALLEVPDQARISELERLRRAPARVSGPEMVRALDRAAEVLALGAGRVDLSGAPTARLGALARYGLVAKAPTLRDLSSARRTATVLATVRRLEAAAVDDALDLFSVLMASRLLNRAQRASEKARVAEMPKLSRASGRLAAVVRVLLEELEHAAAEQDPDGPPSDRPPAGPVLDATRLWEALERVCPREQLAAAVTEVERLTGDPADPSGEEAWRAELLSRFGTVRPFLSLLSEVIPFDATPAGKPILAALRGLTALRKRQRMRPHEIAGDLLTGVWRRLVLANPELPENTVDQRAYIFCVLEHVHRALRRRDIFATVSLRWADPRQHLLDGARWAAVREKVLAGLDLTAPVAEHLAGLAAALDLAYRDTATRIAVNIDAAAGAGATPVVTVIADRDGKARIHAKRLEPVGEPAELVELRELVARMLPRVDLPEVLLEVHAWTGFLSAFTHVTEQVNGTGAASRIADIELSVAACLVAEGCNLGFAPVIKPGHPAFTRDRLSHVDQNYLRAETLSAANAWLIATQGDIGIARLWGGGLLASVDGLRFVVPVQTINAGPNPKYFGARRGVTWLNAVSDQVAGLGAVLVPGTVRDSLYVLDCLLNLDGGAPEMVTSDTASYSDIVFGLFRLLGYQFSPRIADLADQRLWRVDPAAHYGPLDPVSRNKVSTERITTHWEDMLRIAGSLATGTVRAYDLLRMLGRDGHPTPLGAAIADYGRIAKTLHLLAVLDPDDETYRRTINTQLTVQESRHRLARKLFYGQRGELRQRYREGQEDQLSTLGLVLNAVVLWNTRYTDAAVHELRVQGHDVPDDHAARLSPLVDKHLNVHGRYTFTASGLPASGLRALRDPAEPVEDE